MIELERNEEEAMKWREGRLIDETTGIVYHSELSPPPPEAASRVTCVFDDSPAMFGEHVKMYMREREGIRAFYADTMAQVCLCS